MKFWNLPGLQGKKKLGVFSEDNIIVSNLFTQIIPAVSVLLVHDLFTIMRFSFVFVVSVVDISFLRLFFFLHAGVCARGP